MRRSAQKKTNQSKTSLTLGDQSRKQNPQGLKEKFPCSSGMEGSQSSIPTRIRDFNSVLPSVRRSSSPEESIRDEDKKEVVKICVRNRGPTLVNISWTHRTDLEWQIQRTRVDSGIKVKYVVIYQQTTYITTKTACNKHA